MTDQSNTPAPAALELPPLQYLTIVRRVRPGSPEAIALLGNADVFCAASWSHALHERDDAKRAVETATQELRSELEVAGRSILRFANDNASLEAERNALRAEVEALRSQRPYAWSYVPSAVWKDEVLTRDPEKIALAREYGCAVTPLYAGPVVPAAPVAELVLGPPGNLEVRWLVQLTAQNTPAGTKLYVVPAAPASPIAEWANAEQGFQSHVPLSSIPDGTQLYAAAPVQAVPQWQDIATAPKDGTDIMLSNGVVVTEGHWLHDEGGTIEHRDLDGRWIGQDDRDGFDGWIDWHGGMLPEPTHWQPLPAAPVGTEGG